MKEMERDSLTLKVRSWASGDVLKYSNIESWKSGSFIPRERQHEGERERDRER